MSQEQLKPLNEQTATPAPASQDTGNHPPANRFIPKWPEWSDTSPGATTQQTKPFQPSKPAPPSQPDQSGFTTSKRLKWAGWVKSPRSFPASYQRVFMGSMGPVTQTASRNQTATKWILLTFDKNRSLVKKSDHKTLDEVIALADHDVPGWAFSTTKGHQTGKTQVNQ